MNHTSLVSQTGNYTSEKSDTRAYYGFEVLFDHPVILEANKKYKVMSLIKGPQSWYGGNGQTPVDCHGVQFTFRGGSFNGTNQNIGQFPGILFSVSK